VAATAAIISSTEVPADTLTILNITSINFDSNSIPTVFPIPVSPMMIIGMPENSLYAIWISLKILSLENTKLREI